MKKALAFDDVLLRPLYSEIRSRSNPDTSTSIAGIELKIPMISSPMDTVTESRMAIAMGENGGMGIIHRFMSNSSQADNIRDICDAEQSLGIKIPKVFAIGVGQEELERFSYVKSQVPFDAVAIDIANGHHILMKEMIENVRKIDSEIRIIAGNIATIEGYSFLADLSVDAIRVGTGSGSICSTRIKTGFGIPLLDSLMECFQGRKMRSYLDPKKYPSIIADGGIRYPGDMVKAIAAGADAIMCGKIFAQTDESPGQKTFKNGVVTKLYRGMASFSVQQDKRGGLKSFSCAEGVETYIPVSGNLKSVIQDFSGGLRSGMTYANASTLSDLRDNSEFVIITSSGLSESHAFGTREEE